MDKEFVELYNEGERLIPFISHDVMELQRHYSSYVFFCDTIVKDLKATQKYGQPFTILELGFGVGYGSKMMAEIPGSKVTAIDISDICYRYAQKHYAMDNIEYRIEDIAAFLDTDHKFDYIISRGVMEHVPDGINIMKKANYTRRVMFDVPYDENVEANDHHLVTRIREEHFAGFEKSEFLYEDLKGEIFASHQKPPRPNLIMCVCSADDLQPIEKMFAYPLPPQLPPFAHIRCLAHSFIGATPRGKAGMLLNGAKTILRSAKRTGTRLWKH